jgi:hypothetical protein
MVLEMFPPISAFLLFSITCMAQQPLPLVPGLQAGEFSFMPDAKPGSVHAVLSAKEACEGARLNGRPIAAGRLIDIRDELRYGAKNSLFWPAHCGKPELLLYPRVYVAGQKWQGERVALELRNTLDNSVNLYIEFSSRNRHLMMGPETKQTIELEGLQAGEEIRITKLEEAMEGEYFFLVKVHKRP